MHDWIVLAVVLVGTLALSLVFWWRTMPRLSARATSRRMRLWNAIGFGLALLALPMGGLWLLEQRSVALVCAIIAGWAMAVRASGWFAARKWLVPQLKAMHETPAADGNQAAAEVARGPRRSPPAGDKP